MVCIYCKSQTKVANSRHQRRINDIWRRRACVDCGAIFTTIESAEISAGFRIKIARNGQHQAVPFLREKLFLSIYESCRHRANAIEDAAALTKTVLSKLTRTGQALLPRQLIVDTTLAVLENFDTAAATIYRAYHPAES